MHNIISLLLFTFSTCLTPGPNNLMLMSSSMNFGCIRSVPHFLGICLGFAFLIFVVSLGLGALFMHFYWLQITLKILGSTYMLYLAWKISQSKSELEAERTAKPFTFLQAAIFQWINPKAWVMAIGIISLFSLGSNPIMNAVLLSAVYAIVYLPCGGCWMAMGTLIKRILVKEHYQRWFNYFMGGLLALSVVLIFIE